VDYSEYIQNNQKALNENDSHEIKSLVAKLIVLRDKSATLWILGNGGASSTASHCLVDFMKTGQNSKGVGVKCAVISEMVALVTAIGNDIAFENIFSEVLEKYLRPQDAVLALSVSGTSPNIIKAMKTAQEKGNDVFCIFGAKGHQSSLGSAVRIVVNSTDYQIVENVQLALIHWITKELQLA
jgi:D-sedoheptulose 7-phosphate isomerase